MVGTTAAICGGSFSISADAEEPGTLKKGKSGVILDWQEHQDLKAKLLDRIVLIEVQPRATQYQAPGLVPMRFGAGVPVIIDGRAVIVTSWYLVADSESVSVVIPQSSTDPLEYKPGHRSINDPGRTVVKGPVRKFKNLGLVTFPVPEMIAGVLKHAPGKPGTLKKPDLKRTFYCVSPVSPGAHVLTETVVTARAGPPLEKLFMVPGKLTPGTTLFDPDGTPVGLTVREPFSGSDFTLVAAIEAALTPPPKKKAKKSRRVVRSGVWIDSNDPDEDDSAAHGEKAGRTVLEW